MADGENGGESVEKEKGRGGLEGQKRNCHFSECIIYSMEIVIDFHCLVLTYIR